MTTESAPLASRLEELAAAGAEFTLLQLLRASLPEIIAALRERDRMRSALEDALPFVASIKTPYARDVEADMRAALGGSPHV